MTDPALLLSLLVQKFGQHEVSVEGKPCLVCKLSYQELENFYKLSTLSAWEDTETEELVLLVQEGEPDTDAKGGGQACKNSFH